GPRGGENRSGATGRGYPRQILGRGEFAQVLRQGGSVVAAGAHHQPTGQVQGLSHAGERSRRAAELAAVAERGGRYGLACGNRQSGEQPLAREPGDSDRPANAGRAAEAVGSAGAAARQAAGAGVEPADGPGWGAAAPGGPREVPGGGLSQR